MSRAQHSPENLGFDPNFDSENEGVLGFETDETQVDQIGSENETGAPEVATPVVSPEIHAAAVEIVPADFTAKYGEQKWERGDQHESDWYLNVNTREIVNAKGESITESFKGTDYLAQHQAMIDGFINNPGASHDIEFKTDTELTVTRLTRQADGRITSEVFKHTIELEKPVDPIVETETLGSDDDGDIEAAPSVFYEASQTGSVVPKSEQIINTSEKSSEVVRPTAAQEIAKPEPQMPLESKVGPQIEATAPPAAAKSEVVVKQSAEVIAEQKVEAVLRAITPDIFEAKSVHNQEVVVGVERPLEVVWGDEEDLVSEPIIKENKVEVPVVANTETSASADGEQRVSEPVGVFEGEQKEPAPVIEIAEEAVKTEQTHEQIVAAETGITLEPEPMVVETVELKERPLIIEIHDESAVEVVSAEHAPEKNTLEVVPVVENKSEVKVVEKVFGQTPLEIKNETGIELVEFVDESVDEEPVIIEKGKEGKAQNIEAWLINKRLTVESAIKEPQVFCEPVSAGVNESAVIFEAKVVEVEPVGIELAGEDVEPAAVTVARKPEALAPPAPDTLTPGRQQEKINVPVVTVEEKPKIDVASEIIVVEIESVVVQSAESDTKETVTVPRVKTVEHDVPHKEILVETTEPVTVVEQKLVEQPNTTVEAVTKPVTIVVENQPAIIDVAKQETIDKPEPVVEVIVKPTESIKSETSDTLVIEKKTVVNETVESARDSVVVKKESEIVRTENKKTASKEAVSVGKRVAIANEIVIARDEVSKFKKTQIKTDSASKIENPAELIGNNLPTSSVLIQEEDEKNERSVRDTNEVFEVAFA